MSLINNAAFWENLDSLCAKSKIIIDRPKGSRHPKFTETIYPLDYGYFKGVNSTDGSFLDVFIGSKKDKEIDAIVCTADLFKKDSEIALLLGCTKEEKCIVFNFINKYELTQGILINRF